MRPSSPSRPNSGSNTPARASAWSACADFEFWRPGRGHAASGESGNSEDTRCPDRYRLPISETYRFVDDLTKKLDLNLKVFRSEASPAWRESRFGKLWDRGLGGIEQYNRINSRNPWIGRCRSWVPRLGLRGFAGFKPRAALGSLRLNSSAGVTRCIRCLIGRIATWVGTLQKHNLPYHPLWDKGYPSIGDWQAQRVRWRKWTA